MDAVPRMPLPTATIYDCPMSLQTTGSETTVVLSAFPLPRSGREMFIAESGGSAEFLDLASFRGLGTLRALQMLRDLKTTRFIITGEEQDLGVFRDILVLAAGLVRGAQRRCVPRGRPPEAIGTLDFPVAAIRILAGVLAGCWALVTSVAQLRSDTSAAVAAMQCWPPRRCLYLKPAFNLGAPVGGSVGHIAGVSNALCRRGLSVRLLSICEQPMLDDAIQQTGVRPQGLTAYPNELNLFRYHRHFFRQAMREANAFHPDFIYQRYSINDLTGVRMRRRLRIPLILEFNGSETWIQKHWGTPLRFQALSERIETANLCGADLIVVVSEEIAKQVRAAGVPPEKVFFYPNGVDRSVFDPTRFDQGARVEVRRELGVPVCADLYTFVGTFGQWHGTDVLATAIRRLIDETPRFLEEKAIHFLLVGDGQQTPRVRSILGEGLGAPFVTLAGYRPQAETPGILAATDVCLSPHTPNADGTPFFGSPTKLFEYMAMGKPILASDLDQIGWVLRGWRPGEFPPSKSERESTAGILVEPGNVEALIQGIRSAASMPAEERRRLGLTAQAYVDRAFTWERNVDAVMEAFKRRMDARAL